MIRISQNLDLFKTFFEINLSKNCVSLLAVEVLVWKGKGLLD